MIDWTQPLVCDNDWFKKAVFIGKLSTGQNLVELIPDNDMGGLYRFDDDGRIDGGGLHLKNGVKQVSSETKLIDWSAPIKCVGGFERTYKHVVYVGRTFDGTPVVECVSFPVYRHGISASFTLRVHDDGTSYYERQPFIENVEV